jgi:hypothetical protein
MALGRGGLEHTPGGGGLQQLPFLRCSVAGDEAEDPRVHRDREEEGRDRRRKAAVTRGDTQM